MVLAAVGGSVLVAAPAAAAACSFSGTGVGRAVVSSPRDGEVVVPPVTVSGVASSPVPLGRVELVVDGAVVDAVETADAGPTLPFALRWDGDGAADSATRLLVRACGTDGAIRATSAVDVVIAPAATSTSTTAPTSTSTTAPTTTTSTVAPSTTARTTTTARASATSRPAPSPGARTVTIPPPVGTPEVALAAPTRADPSDGRPAALADVPRGEGAGRGPLWVGAVVVASGMAGIALTLRPWRRRAGAVDLEALPPGTEDPQ